LSEINEIIDATIKGNRESIVELIEKAMGNGFAPGDIIQDGFIAAMEIVGQRFSAGELFVPEMLRAARAMKTGLEILKPKMVGREVTSLAKVVLGTVSGDMHDIGKNLVGIMLEGAGIEVVDVGVDVSPDRFVEAVKTHRPNFLGLSALLTTTLSEMSAVINALSEDGLRGDVKVIIGGAPVTQEFADKIGADGYAEDAATAVNRIKELIG
jgi:5-methyltetrahydrofolate--homocysteine methyltransferase